MKMYLVALSLAFSIPLLGMESDKENVENKVIPPAPRKVKVKVQPEEFSSLVTLCLKTITKDKELYNSFEKTAPEDLKEKMNDFKEKEKSKAAKRQKAEPKCKVKINFDE